MNKRSYWIQRVEEAHERKSLVWLSGVRRSGKTTLTKSLHNPEYFDCELPKVRELLSSPEDFWHARDPSNTIVLDEIHRLVDPAETLKIAADHFPKLRVVATGSSTLSAKRKFRDTLTGRKEEIWLTPAPVSELDVFFQHIDQVNLQKRALQGGLPPFLLAPKIRDEDFLEWMDSYWAKDIQELFVVDKKTAFTTFAQLILRQSGEFFQATSFAGPCEVSRQTIIHYLEILETTLLAHAVRPFTSGSAAEIKSLPKVYAFDSGFVSWAKGWESVTNENKGPLLEHLTLCELQAHWNRSSIFYWRNKAKNEVDFILKPGRGSAVHAIECKSQASRFQSGGMKAFRRLFPDGKNVLVTFDALQREDRILDSFPVVVLPVHLLAKELSEGFELPKGAT